MSQTIEVEATSRQPRLRTERAMSPEVVPEGSVVLNAAPDETEVALQQAMHALLPPIHPACTRSRRKRYSLYNVVATVARRPLARTR